MGDASCANLLLIRDSLIKFKTAHSPTSFLLLLVVSVDNTQKLCVKEIVKMVRTRPKFANHLPHCFGKTGLPRDAVSEILFTMYADHIGITSFRPAGPKRPSCMRPQLFPQLPGRPEFDRPSRSASVITSANGRRSLHFHLRTVDHQTLLAETAELDTCRVQVASINSVQNSLAF